MSPRAHLEARRQLCLAAWGSKNCVLFAGHHGGHSTRRPNEHLVPGSEMNLDAAEHALYCGQGMCQSFRPQAMDWIRKHDPESRTMISPQAELSDFLASVGPYRSTGDRISDFLRRNIVLARETPADGEVIYMMPMRTYRAGSGPERAESTASANPNWLRNKARNYLAIADRIEQDERGMARIEEDERNTATMHLTPIAPAVHIVIPRADLPALKTEPAQSGNGVVYLANRAGRVHTSVGAEYAREEALEWLAIADDIEQREGQEADRKDKIAGEHPELFNGKGYLALAPSQRAVVDRIYKLEQQAKQ